MPDCTSRAHRASSPDPDFYRRRYAGTWKPGCERVRWIVRLLDERGIRCEVDGFMADSDGWATGRPSERHVPDIRLLAS